MENETKNEVVEETTETVEETTTNEDVDTSKENEKLFNQEELNNILSKRLKAQETKLNKAFDDKIAEAQKKANMDAEEKAEYERQQNEIKLAQREAEITKRELKAEMKDTLLSKGLPIELAETLNYDNEDLCNASLDDVTKAFNEAVSKTVNSKLRTEPPKTGGDPNITITKAEFDKMTYSQKVDLYNKDKDTYNELTK